MMMGFDQSAATILVLKSLKMRVQMPVVTS